MVECKWEYWSIMTCQKSNNLDVQPGSQRYFYFGVKLTHSRNPCALKSQPCKFGPGTVRSARFDKIVLDGVVCSSCRVCHANDAKQSGSA